MAFALPLESALERACFAVVAAHGATDADVGFACALVYALACMLPDGCTTPLFFAASVLHFALDASLVVSLVVHWAGALVAAAASPACGLRVVGAYLLCVHVPAHYARCWRAQRYRGLLCAAVATAALASRARRRFVLSKRLQRVVLAHVLVDLCALPFQDTLPGHW